jgi:hypothetical protein
LRCIKEKTVAINLEMSCILIRNFLSNYNSHIRGLRAKGKEQRAGSEGVLKM